MKTIKLFKLFSTLFLFFLSTSFNVLFAKEITVYTYDSFASEWGPGQKIAETFEKKTGNKVKYVTFDDANIILSRIILEGKNSKADIALGLDENLMGKALKTGLFAPHQISDEKLAKLTLTWKNTHFLPFDYGWFAFVHRNKDLKSPPSSFAELIAAQDKPLKIIIQDPRSSSPGLGLLLWIQALYEDKAMDAWEKLRPQIKTITGNWGEAYALFLENEADLVLSYTTSPAYHQIIENNQDYSALQFSEGHFMQIETAALLASSDKESARLFLEFLISEEAQSFIPTSQWMFPVADVELPKEFESARPSKTLILDTAQIQANLDNWLRNWRETLSK